LQQKKEKYMLYRKMPGTGDELSILGFGAMRLPQKGQKIDEKRAEAQIRSAIDGGVNYLDTAVPYHMGASEPFLGKVLQDGYREKVKLATKLPHWQTKTKAEMHRVLDAQLKNLNSEFIDYYLIHNLNGESWKKALDRGVLDFLNEAKQAGKIINAGFSFHGQRNDFNIIVDGYDWNFCQIQYNYLDQENQAGTAGLEYAASKGLGVIVMEPLRGGNLAGDMPPAIQKIMDAASVKRSAVEWSLRWIWNRPEVITVLSGMNIEAHIAENIRIASEALPGSLEAEEIELVSRIEKKFRELMKVPCTGCQYCMPCPHGVNIPGCFEVYNSRHMWGNPMMSKIMYVMSMGGVTVEGDASYASLCKECGLCEKACPQEIPIQAELKNVSKEFEGPLKKFYTWLVKKFMVETAKKLKS